MWTGHWANTAAIELEGKESLRKFTRYFRLYILFV